VSDTDGPLEVLNLERRPSNRLLGALDHPEAMRFPAFAIEGSHPVLAGLIERGHRREPGVASVALDHETTRSVRELAHEPCHPSLGSPVLGCAHIDRCAETAGAQVGLDHEIARGVWDTERADQSPICTQRLDQSVGPGLGLPLAPRVHRVHVSPDLGRKLQSGETEELIPTGRDLPDPLTAPRECPLPRPVPDPHSMRTHIAEVECAGVGMLEVADQLVE
jgi:hypothetical protein